jgi:hypothetical protein
VSIWNDINVIKKNYINVIQSNIDVIFFITFMFFQMDIGTLKGTLAFLYKIYVIYKGRQLAFFLSAYKSGYVGMRLAIIRRLITPIHTLTIKIM